MTPPHAPPHSSLRGLGSYREHLERTFRLGTTANGVFASKLMWHQLPELHALATQLPEYAGLELGPLLEHLFARPAYVWVSRRDKARQAVSMWRALQSRSWRHGAGEQAPPRPEPVYRFDGIDHLARSLAAEDRGWQEFFAREAIDALAISYEDDLERDSERAVQAVLARIGARIPAGWRARQPLSRQSDALSEEWVAAYHREREQRASGASPAAVVDH